MYIWFSLRLIVSYTYCASVTSIILSLRHLLCSLCKYSGFKGDDIILVRIWILSRELKNWFFSVKISFMNYKPRTINISYAITLLALPLRQLLCRYVTCSAVTPLALPLRHLICRYATCSIIMPLFLLLRHLHYCYATCAGWGKAAVVRAGTGRGGMAQPGRLMMPWMHAVTFVRARPTRLYLTGCEVETLYLFLAGVLYCASG